MEMIQQIEKIISRFQHPLPGVEAQARMMGRVRQMPATVPGNAKQSAVLCLIFPVNNELNILLMKRREDNTAHSGQVSFPGGRWEPEDIDHKTTALREAYEEVGIPPEEVQILGGLTSLYIPVSNFNVHPFLGYTPVKPIYTLSMDEVSYVLEVPLAELFDKNSKVITEVASPAVPGSRFTVNAYHLEDGTIIWGATAMILSEIEVIMHELAIAG